VVPSPNAVFNCLLPDAILNCLVVSISKFRFSEVRSTDVHFAVGHRKRKMPICAGFRDTKSSRIMSMQFLAILVPHSNTVLSGATYGATQVFLFISVQKLPICKVRNICLWKNANAGYVVLRRILEHEAPPRLKKQFFYQFLLLILMQSEIAKLLAPSR
jgi:hypothetical protein